MNDNLSLLLSAFAGLALGAFFFGGLWWTVRNALTSQRPVAWFLGGGLLRMGVVLTGIYFVAGGHWERLLACLCGLFIARVAVTWLTRIQGPRQPAVAAEYDRAP